MNEQQEPEARAALALVVGIVRLLRRKGVFDDEEVSEILTLALAGLPGDDRVSVLSRSAVLSPEQFT